MKEVQNEKVVVDKLNIRVYPVFDETIPAENNWLFRLVNRLHIDTKKSVIKHDLLIKQGDALDPKLLEESERILRTRNYLNKVSVKSVQDGDKNEVEVGVHQVWTLVPELSFSHAGGNSHFGFGLHDSNFLGYGKTVNITHSSSELRSGDVFEYEDPNTGLANSVFSLMYANNDDGVNRSVSLVRPFFALNTPWAAGIQYQNFEQEDTLYNGGDEAFRFYHQHDGREIFYGAKIPTTEQNAVHRISLGYTRVQDNFLLLSEDDVNSGKLPVNRQFNYPWVEYQYINDKFIEAYNVRQINRIEDINLGPEARVRVGYAASGDAYLDNAYVLEAHYNHGFSLTDNQLLLLDAEAKGLYGDSQFYNSSIKGNVSYHWNNFKNGQFFVGTMQAKGFHLFKDLPFELGGDTGLRGYPARYEAGDRLSLFTVEQRMYGEKEWFSLFHMGAAAFYDQGRVWGDSAIAQDQQGQLRDIGIGLRLSGTRTGNRYEGAHNILHIDLAYPLDGDNDISRLQWLVKVKRSF